MHALTALPAMNVREENSQEFKCASQVIMQQPVERINPQVSAQSVQLAHTVPNKMLYQLFAQTGGGLILA